MGVHRAQAQFDRARWRVWVLIPFWFLQIGLVMASIGIFSSRLAKTVVQMNDSDRDVRDTVPRIRLIWEIVSVGFSASALCLSTFEIARYVGESLTPLAMTASLVIKAALAFGMLALDITVAAEGITGPFTTIGLVLDGVLLLCIAVPLTYAILVYRRLLKYDDYHHPINVKAYGFNSPNLDGTRGFEGEQLGHSATAYSETSMESGKSGGRARSKSSLSVVSVKTLQAIRRVSTGSVNDNDRDGDRRQSLDDDGDLGRPRETYSHERSTDFDAYVRRVSMSKDAVDATVAAEFGWVGSVRPSSGEFQSMPYHNQFHLQQQQQQYQNVIPPIIVRSDSFVSSGTVASAVARPIGEGMGPRTASWSSSRGLVSVPEDEEEEDYDAYESGSQGSGGSRRSTISAAAAAAEAERRKRAGSSASDWQALLSEPRRMSDEEEAGEPAEDSRKRRWAH